MKWHEKKLSDFFNKWEKGTLFLKNGQGYFGKVESLEFANRFDNSIINFICYQPWSEKRTVLLKEIRYFHAQNGCPLNIGKYVKIAERAEKNHLSVIDGGRSGAVKQNEEKVQKSIWTKSENARDMRTEDEASKIFCIAFGLEFHTTEKKARMLQIDLRKLLLSKLEKRPLMSADAVAPVDLTPTFSKWHSKLFGKFRTWQAKYLNKHTVEREFPRPVKSAKDTKE